MDRKLVADTGLSIVYTPSPDVSPSVDIVFVHGLQGHPKRTWTKQLGRKANRSSKARWKWKLGIGRPGSQPDDTMHTDTFWPADLLPNECPSARILTFGYDSIVTKFFGERVNQNHPSANAKDLLYALSRLRKDCQGRPLILVAHSLGGIIVKEALRRAETAEEVSLKDFQSSLKAIVFLGTPHRGSGYAPIGEIVRRVVAVSGADTSNRNLSTLRYDSPELEIAREEFARQWRQGHFLVKTFQEAKGLVGFRGINEKVVPDFSSSLDDPRENAEHIDANHMDMCRFAGPFDAGYIQVGGEIANIVEHVRHQEQIKQKTSDVKGDLATPLSEEELACLQSISFPEMDTRYNSIYEPLDGTCEWLFQRPEYARWLTDEVAHNGAGLLWIKGKPGAGKSTLMKMVLHQIESQVYDKGCTVLRFFYDSRGTTTLEATMLGLFRSLICQLLQQHRGLFHTILPLYRRKIVMHSSEWEWHVQEMKQCFWDMTTAGRTDPLFIIIDALDECHEVDSRELVMLLQDIMSYSPQMPLVRTCLSGRLYPIIQTQKCLEIQVDRFNDNAIKRYVERWLKPNNTFPGVDTLVSEIMKKASGIFLWVVLVVKTLVKARDEGETRVRMLEIVNALPQQLNDLIRQILRSFEPGQAQDALRIMQWIAFSQRPLRLQELRFALETGRNPGFTSQKLVRARTKGLVEVNRHDSLDSSLDDPNLICTLQFIHGSIKDFLLLHQGFQMLDSSLQESESHRHLTIVCINYLGYKDLQDSANSAPQAESLIPVEAEKIFDNLCTSYPFLEYAMHFVFSHAAQAQLSSGPVLLAEQAITSMQQTFRYWRLLSDLYRGKHSLELLGVNHSFAHAVALANVAEWVMTLLRQGFDVNCTGGCFHTLLQAAALMGHEDLVCQLVDAGAEINTIGGRFGNALAAAAYYGNEGIIRALLDRDADVNAGGGEYGPALHTAAQASPGMEAIIGLLLDAKADVNIKGGRYHTALQAGAIAGNKHILKQLLESGAEINAEGGEYGSALQAAASQGHTEVVVLLLSKGAEPHIESGDYGSAVWLAALGGHTNIVRHLTALDLAPSTTSQNSQGDASDFSEELERRINGTMEKASIATKFHEASDQGDISIMGKMLEKGLDVNARGGEWGSAWHTAAFNGNAEAMTLLLAQENIKPDIQDYSGRTALWTAASEGYLKIVHQLLGTGLVNTQVKSASGRNLLWWPSFRGFVEIVKVMLDEGVDPHEGDDDGVSPFMAAQEESQLAVLELLSPATDGAKDLGSHE